MKEKRVIGNGNSMWRWLLLAFLLTSIVAQNFAEPRSVYRIEEVISAAKVEERAPKIAALSHSFTGFDKLTVHFKSRNLQCEQFIFLSQKLHLKTALAVSLAPDLLHIVMRATGQFLKNRSFSSEEPFHFPC
ncbi:hypothetical protein [Dyadobacter sp. CY326]|uniref:hypothetical protein n=1 Tax=Dyadobacter sp. CY326 TaxID=2907300 RepID=UPI001F2AA9B9|nr:hypothetical protein [Dyadobacter sp. CY326]MCE7065426.1 hypothetical protein [Dyadobacter sp. CY326]